MWSILLKGTSGKPSRPYHEDLRRASAKEKGKPFDGTCPRYAFSGIEPTLTVLRRIDTT
jgi:hypothetical protein